MLRLKEVGEMGSRKLLKKKAFPIVVGLVLGITLLMLIANSPAQPAQKVEAARPAEGSHLIADLNANNDGTNFLLTPEGDRSCPSDTIAYYAIREWERQMGQTWPYDMRSIGSVSLEIWSHCWWFNTAQRYTTISFDDQGWSWD
jgi:hypothetical protein